MRFLLAFLCTFSLSYIFAQANQVPIISNLEAVINWDNAEITIKYDVEDLENDPLEIAVHLSDNAGIDYTLTNQVGAPSGDVGFPVNAGTGKEISVPLLSLNNGPIHIRLTALDNQPIDIYELVAQVDSNSLRSRLAEIEGIRQRITAPAKLQETQDSLHAHFTQIGLGVDVQDVPFNAYTGKNYIGNNSGLNTPEDVVIVDAHYDTVNDSPGADDNGSGVVGMLEIAHIIGHYPSLKTLRYIGFDLEETGLTGSSSYVENLPSIENIAGVFNFEMIGFKSNEANSQELPTGFNLLFPSAYFAVSQDSFRGNFITNVGNDNSQSLVDLFAQSAQTYVPDLRVISVVSPGNGTIAPDLLRSDHAPFWISNRKALMLTDGANFRNECYHTTNDLSSKLDFEFMQQVTQATLASVVELAEVQHGSYKTIMAEETLPSQSPDCQVSIWKNNGSLFVKNQTCIFGEKLTLQAYSLDGKLLTEETNIANGTDVLEYQIAMPTIETIVVRLSDSEGKLVWSGAL